MFKHHNPSVKNGSKMQEFLRRVPLGRARLKHVLPYLVVYALLYLEAARGATEYTSIANNSISSKLLNYDSQFAVDGSALTFACSDPLVPAPSWIKLDLRQPAVPVKTVLLFPRYEVNNN